MSSSTAAGFFLLPLTGPVRRTHEIEVTIRERSQLLVILRVQVYETGVSDGFLRPADRHGEVHRGAGGEGDEAPPGAGRGTEGAAAGGAVQGDPAAVQAGHPAGRAACHRERQSP